VKSSALARHTRRLAGRGEYTALGLAQTSPIRISRRRRKARPPRRTASRMVSRCSRRP